MTEPATSATAPAGDAVAIFGGPGRPAEQRRSGHPVMYGRPRTVQPFGRMPHGGGYPHGFLDFAYQQLAVSDPDRVLHVCSGSMRTGIRVDIRPECQPTVVADGTRLPFPAAVFDWVLIDPPYSELLARRHFGTRYPTPRKLLREAARVLTLGGRVGILHYQTPHAVAGLRFHGVHAVYLGPGTRLRAFTVFARIDPTAPSAAVSKAGLVTGAAPARHSARPGDGTGAGMATAAPAGPVTECDGPGCTACVTQPAVGRPARYCSPACRQRAYKARNTTARSAGKAPSSVTQPAQGAAAGGGIGDAITATTAAPFADEIPEAHRG
ncbi:MAG: class I SAM-dependent methyltransferase [Mycobacteriales bacterium]